MKCVNTKITRRIGGPNLNGPNQVRVIRQLLIQIFPWAALASLS